MINLMNVLIGFFSKQFVLYSALQNGYYFISLIAIIVSVISASYYLKIIKVLHTFNYPLTSALPGLRRPVGFSLHKASTSAPALAVLVSTRLVSLCPWGIRPRGDQRAEARGGVALSKDDENNVLAKVESLYTNEPMVENNLDPIIYGPSGLWLIGQRQSKYTLTNTHSFLISSLTLIILLFFIKPSIILNSTQLLSLSLFYI
jgi:hypothetical protein